jgi:hypothetical protein
MPGLMGCEMHNVALKSDGTVWAWGWNAFGQLGNGTTNATLQPTPVVGLGPRVGLPLTVAANALPGFVDLSWSSATGEYFSVECSTNLASGFFDIGQNNLPATPPLNVVTLPVTNARAFFRLRF